MWKHIVGIPDFFSAYCIVTLVSLNGNDWQYKKHLSCSRV